MTKRSGARFFPIAVALCLAGCSASEKGGNTAANTASTGNMAIENAARPAPDVPIPPPDLPINETVGGDGSQIIVDPLSSAELEASKLEGELACSFAQGDQAPILFAMGDVGSSERSQGVVKVAGYIEAVGAPGGFETMRRGTRFAGKGKTIKVEVTGPATGGGESPSSPAMLTYVRADGARRVFAGNWTCGP